MPPAQAFMIVSARSVVEGSSQQPQTRGIRIRDAVGLEGANHDACVPTRHLKIRIGKQAYGACVKAKTGSRARSNKALERSNRDGLGHVHN